MNSEVICIGAAIVDIPLYPVGKYIFDVESYPLSQIRMTIGGDAINEATIIRRLGHSTALMTLVGDDPAGRFVLDFCKNNSIGTESARIDPEIETSINIGLVSQDGERTFVTNRNGSLWKFAESHIRLDRFAGARLLSLASIFNNPLLNNDALVRIFRTAKDNGMIICADMIKPRLGEELTDIREALSYIDYFFPNYAEASLLTRETDLQRIANVFLAIGIKHVIIKNGKKGCYIKDSSLSLEVPTYSRIQAIDTIGAGDNFVSGFISGLLEGKTLRECAYLANAVATISVTQHGATAGVQNRGQVDSLLEDYVCEAIQKEMEQK